MLLKADVVNSFFLNLGGHTTPSCTYFVTTASPNCAEISRMQSYETLMPLSWRISIKCLFLVLAYMDIPIYKEKGSHDLWNAFELLFHFYTYHSNSTAVTVP